MSELTGKRALVTGASSGIGAAIALELAAQGVALVLTARRRDALQTVANACIERGARVEIVTVDLGRAGAATGLWNTVRTTGSLDILINNAGFGYFRPFSAADWRRDAEMLQLNMTSLVELSRRFLDDRRTATVHSRAYLLNIASIGAYQSVPNMALYAATKAFVRNFTEALHDELRGSHVSATCVCPGGTVTGFHEAAGAGNYGWLANVTMMSPQSVARVAVRAMVRGKRNVVPGIPNKIATWSVRLFPRRFASWVASRVLGRPRAEALPARTAA